MKAKFLQQRELCSIQYIRKPFRRTRVVAFRVCCVVLSLLIISFADAAKVEDFMPQESVFYAKLQNIDEVYSEIETSEDWEKALAILATTPNWQETQQGLAMLQVTIGTDLLGIVETVGYRTGFAAWQDELDSWQVGIVIHSGGNLARLQQLTKVVEGLIGMSSENTLRLDAGVYQRVRYNAMERFDLVIKYGFVDEFLVIGGGEGAFEKLLDTFRKQAASISKNMQYAKISKKSGSGQVLIFSATHLIPKNTGEADVLGAVIAEGLLTGLKSFEIVFGELNLLEKGEFLTLHGQLTEKTINQFSEIVTMPERLFKKENTFKTVKAVSPDGDMFVALAPVVSEVIWQLINKFIAESADDNVYEAISFLEGILNLNLEDDILPSLTGEIAIAVNDFTQFDPTAFGNMEANFEGTFTLDASGAETQGTLIFNASNSPKWNQLNNSISNLQNQSVSQTDHKGVTVSTFATNLHYSNVDGLFLLGASEEQMYSLIDEIQNGKSPVYFMQLPKTSIAIAQLNLARALEMEKGAPPADRVIVNSSQISPLLAWISVKDDEASLQMTLSRRGTGLEALARLMPFFLWSMEQE